MNPMKQLQKNSVASLIFVVVVVLSILMSGHIKLNNEAQKVLSDQLGKMAKDETVTEMYTGYNELFLYPATLAFILLLLDLTIVAVIDQKKSKKRQ